MNVTCVDRAVDLWAIARAVDGRRIALLDSFCDRPQLGRWSMLGLFPRREIVSTAGPSGTAVTRHGPVGDLEVARSDPLTALQAFVDSSAADRHDAGDTTLAPPPLVDGAIGYLAYELLHSIERIAPSKAPPARGALMHFMQYGTVIAVDHFGDRTFVCADDESADDANRLVAAAPPQVTLEIVPHGGDLGIGQIVRAGFDPVVERDEYLAMVAQAKELIHAGNAFELCLTQEFRGPASADGPQLYERMRRLSPVPMGAYLRHDDMEVLCCSPERFLRGDADGNLETRPIKGTRARSADPVADKRLCDDLCSAPKDRAENVMIADLARNDLGRVCGFGSVAVHELCAVESYATVHHLVSTVRGRMRPGQRATDAIRAAFPGGSMTGAPKVEAMRQIARLERSRRGVYSGAIGWLGADGAFDLNIAIRTIIRQGDEISFHSGGAITADSDAAVEYDETMVKARALVEAVSSAAGETVPGDIKPPSIARQAQA